ncbi:alpha/beta hydrolase domain-containing protein [Calothrix sp. NIES-4071]|nr:alpha/beta hydrolase domain-containing protein [Calothrix sp. NIES-4071]BAZ60896.1 alpha/beta hydrolase domain-containing protein [Calothrix sp. NIES-4105]
MFKLSRVIVTWLVLLLSLIGLFLSAWILIPAPTMPLLVLSVGAREVCPWLLIGNIITLITAWFLLRRSFRRLALIASLVGLLICGWELISIQPAQAQMENEIQQQLGKDYLTKIPVEAKTNLRSTPFSFADSFLGINKGKTRHLEDVPFTTQRGIDLNMEIYQPPEKGIYPALVVIYGGAWRSGSPKTYLEFNQYMAARGYTVFAIDYRHAPRYRYPVQLEDVVASLGFIRQNAAKYEADPERVVLFGRSSGAHLAMLAAYKSNALPVRGVISYYGPVNLTEGYNDPPHPDPINTRAVLEDFLGGSPQQLPSEYQVASPINYVKDKVAPTLLIYGSQDHVVEAKYGRQIYQGLRKEGNTAVLLEIPWAEHGFDAVFNGVSNQLALYYTERFLAWAALIGN